MSTLTSPRSNVKALRPVHGSCRWVRRPPSLTALGTLAINGAEYDFEAHLAGKRVLGFRLVKTDDTAYDVDASGDYLSCDCPDGTYCQNRPGGCMHIRALQAAGLVADPPKPAGRVFRSAGDMAANDPEAFDREMEEMASYFGQS